MPQHHNPQAIARARALRKRQTEAESLLWFVLRGRRLCGLKFRRQFPVEPFIADFACVEERLIVEIDGGYHDYTCADDQSRQLRLEQSGWKVLRFTNEEVLDDVEAVAIAIARHVNRAPIFRPKQSPE